MTELENAMNVVATHITNDPEYAWVWHCNITTSNMDGGYLKWKESNEAACRTMKRLFDVDTSPKFIELLKTRSPTKVINV